MNSVLDLSRYPGAKNAPGVFQTIINEMPPHDVYVEAFVGSGAIFKRKRLAIRSVVIDQDEEVARHWSTIAASGEYAGLTAVHGDARSLIAGYDDASSARGVLVYCDPPYVPSTRRGPAPIYRHEFSQRDHCELLDVLLRLKCNVMLSGYQCTLYDNMLRDWRRVDYQTATHRGAVTESLWCNFPKPTQLHDLRYVGETFRDRERMKRQRARWRARLAKMPEPEQRALLAELLGILSPDSAMRDLAGSSRQIQRGRPLASPVINGDAAGGGAPAASPCLTMLEVAE